MYPQRELTQLAARKFTLRRDIALHRAQCVEAAVQMAKPLAWLDRVVAFWRRLSPLVKLAVVAVPLGLLVKRKVSPRQNILGLLLRWSPFIFGIVRGINSVEKTRAGYSRSANGRS
jgi:hypothetical protein